MAPTKRPVRSAFAVLTALLMVPAVAATAAPMDPSRPVALPPAADAGKVAAPPEQGGATEHFVELVPSGSGVDAAKAVRERGGRVDQVLGDGFVSAWVPADQLEELATDPRIADVGGQTSGPPAPHPERRPTGGTTDPSQAGSVTMYHVNGLNFDDWHAAGYTGQGVNIAVFDSFKASAWQSAQASGDVPAPTRTFCRRFGESCTLFREGADTHGVGVAEIIHDGAPGANLYLVDARTTADHIAAVSWLASLDEDIHVINRSLGHDFDGPGDGTGPMGELVDYAVGLGMTWFNSAGNSAGTPGSYYRRTGLTSSSGWIVWPESGNGLLPFQCIYIQGMRWTDWGSNNPTDLDMHVYSDAGGTDLIARSQDTQADAGDRPVETLTSNDYEANGTPLDWSLDQQAGCTTGTTVYLAVRVFDVGDGIGDDRLEFLTNGLPITGAKNPYSATQPVADSHNPGMMTIGAITPADGYEIAPSSARGPTNATAARGERIKPDLAVASGFESAAAGYMAGTSSATPVVAGMAAVIRSAGVATTPQSITTYLRSIAQERGPAGPDNTYGYGEPVLPAPPTGGSGPAGPADLVMTAKAASTTVEPTEDAGFRLTVKNAGGATASAVNVKVDVPLTLDDATATLDGETCPLKEEQNPFGVPETGRVCDIGSLPAGATATVIVRGRLTTDSASVGGTARTSSQESDGTNNWAQATVELWELPSGAHRLAGGDRYATAAAIATDPAAPPAGKIAYLTTGENFPDALAGAPLAAKNKGAILLTQRTQLPAATAEALGTIKPQTIVALGSTGVLSEEVLAAAAAAAGGAKTDRIGGGNRYHTAALIADRLGSRPDVVHIALGSNFPDALAASPVVGANPILLVEKDTVPPDTLAALQRLEPGKVVALGGEGVLTNATLFAAAAAAGTEEVGRYYGADRYATAVDVATQGLAGSPTTVYVAVGTKFPDALGGGPSAARELAPMLLVEPENVPASVATYLEGLDGLQRIVVLGGPGVISQGVMDLLELHIELTPPPAGSGDPGDEPIAPDGGSGPPPPPGSA